MEINDISDEMSTVMISMPDGAVLSLTANKQISNEKLRELVESLTVID